MLRAGTANADVDEAVTEVWNTKQTALLRNVATPLGRFGRGIDLECQRRCQKRQMLVSEAVECHEAGRYAAAMTLALSQVDGITREVVGKTFFQANPDATEPGYTDDKTLAGVEGNLPVVRKAFSAPVDRVGRYSSVSRHGIIHGMDLTFATKVNSTKTLVLVGALAEHLESRASARAKRWRRDRDVRRSTLTGFDDNGRLRDDRHLEELYLFRAEFESRMFHAILSPHGPTATSLLEVARDKLPQQSLWRARFSLLTVERDGVAWTYRTPRGHWMGSALRIRDCATFPIEQEHWTWDAAGPPLAAPWSRPDGWTATDGDPRTPNWGFGGFYLD
ncbi:hypothetical protein J7E68_03395 [Microbacterium sp. ISL-103]|uniref:hypothetical protein n=1 Tax=Microbacterium sp. ISL-103 TaxID=2819156 RepID=UPI001BEC8CFC|nr:hypothetical protein [Microbacterium sp. ISL-103]MBT2473644.1 hypothetical protein [Microbacterium sp. ISL-103]